ncbi:hypothetical protein [Streptomyces sp. NPDC101455]
MNVYCNAGAKAAMADEYNWIYPPAINGVSLTALLLLGMVL